MFVKQLVWLDADWKLKDVDGNVKWEGAADDEESWMRTGCMK